jgi:hypothetical protein
MKNKKELEKSSLKDQLNSTQIDMSQSELMKMSDSVNQSLNNNSKPKSAESKDFDLNSIYLIPEFFHLTIIYCSLFIFYF